MLRNFHHHQQHQHEQQQDQKNSSSSRVREREGYFKILRKGASFLVVFYAGYFVGYQQATYSSSWSSLWSYSSRHLSSSAASLPYGYMYGTGTGGDGDNDDQPLRYSQYQQNTNDQNRKKEKNETPQQLQQNNNNTATKQKVWTEQDVHEMVQHRIDLFTKLHTKRERRAQQLVQNQPATKTSTTTTATTGRNNRRQHPQRAQRARRLAGRQQQQQQQQQQSHDGKDETTTNPPMMSSPVLFPTETQAFVSGMSLVDRHDFAQWFDTGVPLDESSPTNQKVLLLHARNALPADYSSTSTTSASAGRRMMIPTTIDNLQDAVQNCNYLNVIYTQPNRPDQCIAIMGQYNSYHVHKFMRVAEKDQQPTMVQQDSNNQKNKMTTTGGVTIDPSLPLRLVSRGIDTEHSFRTKTPTLQQTKQYWNATLRPYLQHLEIYLQELRPHLKRVALCKSVIIMVCNYGQVELLMNFVCAARSSPSFNNNNRNRDDGNQTTTTTTMLDLSGILVFATDPETELIAKGLGLEVYYNPELFRNIPKEHASRFGDQTYADAIVAKIYCVQLVSMLGYHVLFQDVDMIWYKDPLEYFQNLSTLPSSPSEPLAGFDIYLQHDGNHAQFYAPWSGNTGFYYVRNNPRTQYFLNHFLVAGGDLIAATKAHQAPFSSVLSEHASLHGLKVKILPTDDFPGGLHFQRQPNYMKQHLGGGGIPLPSSPSSLSPGQQEDQTSNRVVDPYIFHMSWTVGKNDKVKFFQQMGSWYVKDTCLNYSSGDNNETSANMSAMEDELSITKTSSDGTTRSNDSPVETKCCSAQPIISCHYRDKPSVVPCLDSPPYGKGSSIW